MGLHPPLWSPRFQYIDGVLQYKPFPRYPTWLLAWDVSEITVAIEALIPIIAELSVVDASLAADIASAIGQASTAQAAADAAQATADDALAAANGVPSLTGRMSILWDEAQLVTGTRTIYRVAGMDYGLGAGAASLINNEMKMSFFCDISLGGFLHFHVLTNNGSGIMTVSIDGTVIGTIDLYTAVQTLNVDKTLPIDFGDFPSGRHTLSLKGATKHASSSGYAIVVTKAWFYDGSD